MTSTKMPVSSYDDVERELILLLRRGRAWSRDIAAELHEGLQPTAYALLSRVNDLESVRASELCGHFGMDKGAMSRTVAELESAGLLVRAPDPDDGRAQRLALSMVGRRRLAEARGARRQLVRDRLEEWAPVDVATFAELLSRFNRQLEAAVDTAFDASADRATTGTTPTGARSS